MLRISPSQYEALRESADVFDMPRLVAGLRESYPETVGRLPDDLLTELAQVGVSRAQRFGFSSGTDIATFVYTMFAIGSQFDAHPRIRPLLSDHRIPLGKRFDVIARSVPDSVWDEVRSRYDGSEGWA